MSPTLSVVIPVYNERKTILDVIAQVQQVDIPQKEIVIVDDGSSDGTREILSNVQEDNVKVVFHPHNQGKGAAIRTGFGYTTGEFIVVQDADLEYDPNDFTVLLEQLAQGKADIVYGSRFLEANAYSSWKYRLANLILTKLANFLYGGCLSDSYTCYKMVRREVLTSLQLKSVGFEIEAELTAKLLKSGFRIAEVPISYRPRSVLEGKKIKARDGFLGVWTLLRYRLVS